MTFKYIIVILAIHAMCNSERVYVELAKGGWSRPLDIKPLEHNHDYDNQEHPQLPPIPKADALSMDDPTDHSNIDSEISDTHEGENGKKDLEWSKPEDFYDMPQRDESADVSSDYEEIPATPEKEPAVEEDLPAEEDEMQETESTILEEIESPDLQDPESPDLQDPESPDLQDPESPGLQDPESPDLQDPDSPVVLEETESPVLEATESPDLSTPSPTEPIPIELPTTVSLTPMSTTLQSQMPSTASSAVPIFPTHKPDPTIPCHQDCLAALNATRLYSEQKLLLSPGSDLTLICELPLNPSFILEDLIWLYHPENSPTHQCSLTAQEFLPSCQGFQTIKDTDDRNDTFVRESITLTNMLTNYSGQYMCQIKITCCPESKEHIMGQERISYVKVQVWLADYTVELAVAGSITAALAIIVLGGSFCISRKQKAHYTFITDDIQEIKQCTVLHIPLVEDNDNDSFDSNFEEQD